MGNDIKYECGYCGEIIPEDNLCKKKGCLYYGVKQHNPKKSTGEILR